MPLLRHWLGGASSIGDGLDGPPEGDAFAQWILGVIFPVIIGIGGVVFLVRQTYGFGTFVAIFAAFLHFHYFWGLTEEHVYVSVLGKNIAALGMILCLAYGMYVFIFRM
jgi:hypothetical protein